MTQTSLPDPVPVTTLINLCNIKLSMSTYLLWNHKVCITLSSFNLLGFIDGTSTTSSSIVTVDGAKAPNSNFISCCIKDQRILSVLFSSLSDEYGGGVEDGLRLLSDSLPGAAAWVTYRRRTFGWPIFFRHVSGQILEKEMKVDSRSEAALAQRVRDGMATAIQKESFDDNDTFFVVNLPLVYDTESNDSPSIYDTESDNELFPIYDTDSDESFPVNDMEPDEPFLVYAKFGIPRLIFHGTSKFARCGAEQMELHKLYKNVSSDSEPFVVPNLPHQLTFSEKRSYGEVINSFYELEPDYADHYKNVLGIRAWDIGPLPLCNNGAQDKFSQRGKKSAIDQHECLAWLDSKRPNLVVYEGVKNQDENEDWLPQGFEERIKGRGWAPQLMILDHPAIGAFVTHCGWNPTLEGICAGVPMVTWPVFAQQFFNEKLVTRVLGTGVSVGNKKWQVVDSEGVGSEAVKRIMVGRRDGGNGKQSKVF
ncbi:hypothetical protein ACS0TY_026513 [Phlomoides rotata]